MLQIYFHAQLKMCGLEHFSLPFKRIPFTVGENVGNHFVALTKINIQIKMKLAKASGFPPPQGPSLAL